MEQNLGLASRRSPAGQRCELDHVSHGITSPSHRLFMINPLFGVRIMAACNKHKSTTQRLPSLPIMLRRVIIRRLARDLNVMWMRFNHACMRDLYEPRVAA